MRDLLNIKMVISFCIDTAIGSVVELPGRRLLQVMGRGIILAKYFPKYKRRMINLESFMQYSGQMR